MFADPENFKQVLAKSTTICFSGSTFTEGSTEAKVCKLMQLAPYSFYPPGESDKSKLSTTDVVPDQTTTVFVDKIKQLSSQRPTLLFGSD